MQNLFEEIINIKKLSDTIVASEGAQLRLSKIPVKYRALIREKLSELPGEFDKHLEKLDEKKSKK